LLINTIEESKLNVSFLIIVFVINAVVLKN